MSKCLRCGSQTKKLVQWCQVCIERDLKKVNKKRISQGKLPYN